MGVGYELVNLTKRERVMFAHLPVNTAKEICGNPVSAALVSWYLLCNGGDAIRFVDDCSENGVDTTDFPDRTDDLVRELVEAGILEDHGFEWRDDEEPDTVFIRDIRNCWMTGA